MNIRKKLGILSKLLITGILLSVNLSLFAQVNNHVPSEYRGDPNLRRKSHLDGNNLRTTVFNFGFSGRTADVPDEFPYEWPKNTGRDYVALVAIWMGGEVQDETGKTIQVIDFPTFRSSPGGASWNLEPVPGFLNPESGEIARSDKSETWPTAAQGGWADKRDDPVDPGWVGSWNGFFGKNVFSADQEMFYRASDDLYTRFNYIPDTTDASRGGLGLLMDVRAMAWTQVLIQDVVFFIHDVLNDGTKRIPKTSFLIWLADIVGGDANDDEPFVDLQTNIAFLTDADRVGGEEFGNDPVGLASIKFLETPGNQVDGIDNDGDADEHPELIAMIDGDPTMRIPHFTEADFTARQLTPGDKIVLIDSTNFSRMIIEYPEGGGTVRTLGRTFNLPAEGITLFEDTLANQLDDDLDGLIDERLTLHLERFNEITGTEEPVRYINYLFFEPGDTLKRGFIIPGKNTPMNYNTMAPMIDESRDDGFDNDGDWNALTDDVGLDGVEQTGDPGEGDGSPTSGTGTGFPGEPNIDKTDVSETDLIGITSVMQDPAGNINFSLVSDAFIWRTFMTPGRFFIPRPTGEYDTYVSSGFFPIDPGERQRMAISVAMAGGNQSKALDIEDAIRKQQQARTAYESDYTFAQAPLQPTVTAVPGDGTVTLYWDDVAESSEDRFLKSLGAPFRDFEGYRIYRATDPAFQDAKVITNGFGTDTYFQPIAQFDLADGITGFHPIDFNGVKYWMGNDSGLKHSFTDTDLINGQLYYYVVVAYDFGYVPGNIQPSESSFRIEINPQGQIEETSSNAVAVRPRAPVAGYLPAEVESFQHVSGTSSGQISFDIVDPGAIKDGHEYEITFEDTLIRGQITDVLTTKSFTVTDITDGSVKLAKSTLFNVGDEVPLIDGFRLSFINEPRVEINQAQSGWNNPEVYRYNFSIVSLLNISGELRPNDYRFIFGESAFGSSKDTSIAGIKLESREVNFQVENFNSGQPVEFAFFESHGDDGHFSVNPTQAGRTDLILLLEPDEQGRLVWTWQVTLRPLPKEGRNPQAGDTLTVILRKPFLSQDVYRFTMKAPEQSIELAKENLDRIRVVPNPYIVTEIWEPRNPFSSGRGPRELHFINLPQKCTIRIFDVNGTLIDKLEHHSTLNNGTAIWDMLSRDNLEISYGIYVYHIDAPGIGEKTGTFAIIK